MRDRPVVGPPLGVRHQQAGRRAPGAARRRDPRLRRHGPAPVQRLRAAPDRRGRDPQLLPGGRDRREPRRLRRRLGGPRAGATSTTSSTPRCWRSSRPAAAGQVFNIGNPHAAVDTNGLAREFAELVPGVEVESEVVDRAEVAYRTPVVAKAAELLGFEPKVSLRRGPRAHDRVDEVDAARGGRRMNVSIIGVGKMGLPLAVWMASRGATVRACDINPRVVDAINAGTPDIDEPGVRELLLDGLAAGPHQRDDRHAAARGRKRRGDRDRPGRPHRRQPGRPLEPRSRRRATSRAACGPGTLVVYETTVPVGTTREVLVPILETSGHTLGDGLRRRVLARAGQEPPGDAPPAGDAEDHRRLRRRRRRRAPPTSTPATSGHRSSTSARPRPRSS